MKLRLKQPLKDAATKVGAKRAFVDGVDQHYFSKQLGENGMPEYTDEGLGSDLLALNQMVRGAEPAAIARKILNVGTPMDIAHLLILMEFCPDNLQLLSIPVEA